MRSASPRQNAEYLVVRTGKLVIDLEARTVEVGNQPLRLTRAEYGILELLSLHKGVTVTKAMFLDHLYDGMGEPRVRIIDVFVSKLRKKLAGVNEGQHYIETVWGRGYALCDPRPGECPSKHRGRATQPLYTEVDIVSCRPGGDDNV
jgi:two-component system, cell cycle response regulator CtrA